MRASATSSELLQRPAPSRASVPHVRPRRRGRGARAWLALCAAQAAATACAIVTIGVGPGLVLSSCFVGLPATGLLWLGRERRRR